MFIPKKIKKIAKQEHYEVCKGKLRDYYAQEQL
jgi:hypothetical protein